MNMKILYISVLSSSNVIESLHQKTGRNPGFAVQKFSRLVAEGLAANGAKVVAFSCPPIGRDDDKSYFIHLPQEEHNGVKYRYIPFINLPAVKHLCVFVSTFLKVFFFGGGLRIRKIKPSSAMY